MNNAMQYNTIGMLSNDSTLYTKLQFEMGLIAMLVIIYEKNKYEMTFILK